MLADQIKPAPTLPLSHLPQSVELADHNGGRLLESRAIPDETADKPQLCEV